MMAAGPGQGRGQEAAGAGSSLRIHSHQPFVLTTHEMCIWIEHKEFGFGRRW